MPCLQISNLLLPESLIAPACCFVLSADRVSKPKRHPTYSVENLIIQKKRCILGTSTCPSASPLVGPSVRRAPAAGLRSSQVPLTPLRPSREIDVWRAAGPPRVPMLGTVLLGGQWRSMGKEVGLLYFVALGGLIARRRRGSVNQNKASQ